MTVLKARFGCEIKEFTMFDQVMSDFVRGMGLCVSDRVFYGHNLTFYEFFNFALITQFEAKQVSEKKKFCKVVVEQIVTSKYNLT